MKISKTPMEVIDHTYELEIEPLEKLVISFSPEGANRLLNGGKKIKIALETIFLNNGRIALVIKMSDSLYQNQSGEDLFIAERIDFKNALFFVDDPNGADIIEFPERFLKLVKVNLL